MAESVPRYRNSGPICVFLPGVRCAWHDVDRSPGFVGDFDVDLPDGGDRLCQLSIAADSSGFAIGIVGPRMLLFLRGDRSNSGWKGRPLVDVLNLALKKKRLISCPQDSPSLAPE